MAIRECQLSLATHDNRMSQLKAASKADNHAGTTANAGPTFTNASVWVLGQNCYFARWMFPGGYYITMSTHAGIAPWQSSMRSMENPKPRR